MRIFVGYIKRLLLYYKQMSFWLIVPFVVLIAVVPFLYFGDLKGTHSYEEFLIAFQNDLNLFLPLIPSWCSFFVMKEYIDAKGNELLFLYGNKIKLFEYFLVSVPVWLLNFLELAIIVIINSLLLRYALCLVLVQIFIYLLLFAVVFLSGSITISMLTVMLYFIANEAIIIDKPLPLIYSSISDYSSCNEVGIVFFPIVISLPFLIAIGLLKNKRFAKYN